MAGCVSATDLSESQALSSISSRITDSFRMLQGERREAALDFLLGWDKDVPGDIAALANPFSFAMSSCARHDVATWPLPEMAGMFPSVQFQQNMALMPVWCMGGVTVGVGIEVVESLQMLNNPTGLPTPNERGFHWGRWCRDEKTSEFIVIWTAYPAGDCDMNRYVTISHWRDESATARSHHYVRCNWAALMKHGPPTGSHSFLDSVLSSTVTSHRRECTVCGIFSCNCTLPYASPTGGLDFASFRNNAEMGCGKFLGICSLFARPNVECKFSQISSQVSWVVSALKGLTVTTGMRETAMKNRMLVGGQSQGSLTRGIVAPLCFDQTGPEPAAVEKVDVPNPEGGKGEVGVRDVGREKDRGLEKKAVEASLRSELGGGGTKTEVRRRSRKDDTGLTPQQAERRRRNRDSANRFNRNRAALILNLEHSLGALLLREKELLERKLHLEGENAELRRMLYSGRPGSL